jgi:hypothetical protein
MDLKFETLRFKSFELTAEVTKTIIWPPGFKGILLRDSVGYALKNTLSPEKYQMFWQRKLSKEISLAEKIGEDSPRGYVIEPPNENKRKYITGEKFSIRIILVGSLTNMIDDFIKAFEKLGAEFWLGRKKGYGSGKFKIKNVNMLSVKIPQPKPVNNLIINFTTPTRIVNEATNRPLVHKSGESLDFKSFIKALYRRLYLLNKIICENNEQNYNSEIALADAINIKTTLSNLHFHELESQSEKGIKKFGGFTGEIVFNGDIAPFFEMILLGERLHVGKDYVYGMGKYEIL